MPPATLPENGMVVRMMGHKLRQLAIVAALLAWPAGAAAPASPGPAAVMPDPVLAAGDLRAHLDLSGVWHYSIDPYRAGQAGFHGEAPGESQRRYATTDVEQTMRDRPSALFEYDMTRAPVATLPSSWLTHSAEMRHYRGLVWYQRDFTADPGRARASSCASARPITARTSISTASMSASMRAASPPSRSR